MTKQEEIRGGIGIIIGKKLTELMPDRFTIPHSLNGEDLGRKLLEYLQSQGVVLKVERELPPFAYVSEVDLNAKTEIQQNMLRAGYCAVEPLVQEQ